MDREGEVTGDGTLSWWSGMRGLATLRGEDGCIGRAGDDWRCGDGTFGSLRLLRLYSLVLEERGRELGDSVCLPSPTTEVDRFESLSPASLPMYIELRLLTDCDRFKKAILVMLDRGVGHSKGLLDLDDGASDVGRRSRLADKDDTEVLRKVDAMAGCPS